MQQINMQLGNLPVNIIFLQDGRVGFHPHPGMWPTIIDQPEQGVMAIISTADIAIGANTVIDYGVAYEYKAMPELLAWLQTHNLHNPL